MLFKAFGENYFCILYVYSLSSIFIYFIVGLDAAGKTTILYKLKLGEIVTTIPTIGMSFNSNASDVLLFIQAGRAQIQIPIQIYLL